MTAADERARRAAAPPAGWRLQARLAASARAWLGWAGVALG